MTPILHASTIVARSPSAILSYLSRLPYNLLTASHSLLFTLSGNMDAADLSHLVSRLTSLYQGQSIGGLSAPLPCFTDYVACSLMVFEGESSRVFRSTIPGRAAPQVGRWHAFRNKDEGEHIEYRSTYKGTHWEDVWDRSVEETALPEELRDMNTDDVNAVIYLTDKASEGLSNSLASLRHTDKLGLVASSTPFITGRPATLFHKNSIFSSGAVGIALTGGKSRASVEFSGLQAIAEPFTITRSEGNLINELSSSNPTRLLLAAIRNWGIERDGSFKEDEFYLGVLQGQEKLNQVYRITSGDPSRGTIALESHAAPLAGTVVQFHYRPKVVPLELPSRFLRPLRNRCTLSFMTSLPDPSPQADGNGAVDSARVFQNVFLASSENGFDLSRGEEAAWRCTVPGGLSSLRWPLLV